jgi:hypothetical protein
MERNNGRSDSWCDYIDGDQEVNPPMLELEALFGGHGTIEVQC